MANPVVHFEVLGKDATTLKNFYGGAFGWQLEDVMEGSYYMANTGGERDIPGGIGASPVDATSELSKLSYTTNPKTKGNPAARHPLSWPRVWVTR